MGAGSLLLAELRDVRDKHLLAAAAAFLDNCIMTCIIESQPSVTAINRSSWSSAPVVQFCYCFNQAGSPLSDSWTPPVGTLRERERHATSASSWVTFMKSWQKSSSEFNWPKIDDDNGKMSVRGNKCLIGCCCLKVYEHFWHTIFKWRRFAERWRNKLDDSLEDKAIKILICMQRVGQLLMMMMVRTPDVSTKIQMLHAGWSTIY